MITINEITNEYLPKDVRIVIKVISVSGETATLQALVVDGKGERLIDFGLKNVSVGETLTVETPIEIILSAA